jgi:hypothetical protein
MSISMTVGQKSDEIQMLVCHPHTSRTNAAPAAVAGLQTVAETRM